MALHARRAGDGVAGALREALLGGGGPLLSPQHRAPTAARAPHAALPPLPVSPPALQPPLASELADEQARDQPLHHDAPLRHSDVIIIM